MKEADHRIVGDRVVAYFPDRAGYSLVEYGEGKSRHLLWNGSSWAAGAALANYEVVRALTDKELPWKISARQNRDLPPSTGSIQRDRVRHVTWPGRPGQDVAKTRGGRGSICGVSH